MNISNNNEEQSINHSSTKRIYKDSSIYIYENLSDTQMKKMKISKNNQKYPLIREPINYQYIFNLKDKEEWFKAVNEKLQNMIKLKVLH